MFIIVGIQTALAVAFTADNLHSAATTNVSYQGNMTNSYNIHELLALNVYNTTGWVAAALGVINLVLFLPYIFKVSKNSNCFILYLKKIKK